MPGGWGGIRTHGGREPTPVFKTGALNHSATHPSLEINDLANLAPRTNCELAPDWHREGPYHCSRGARNTISMAAVAARIVFLEKVRVDVQRDGGDWRAPGGG